MLLGIGSVIVVGKRLWEVRKIYRHGVLLVDGQERETLLSLRDAELLVDRARQEGAKP